MSSPFFVFLYTDWRCVRIKEIDNRKYFVVKVKGNDETILFKYDDANAAKENMEVLGKKLKLDRGIICVVKACLNEDGSIDYRGREDIAVYNR